MLRNKYPDFIADKQLYQIPQGSAPRSIISVPLFNDNERNKFFAVSAKIKDKLNGLSANDSKIGFVLQLGYFKATGKFFSEYNHDDRAF